MKKIITTPFNRFKTPPKQNLFFLPFILLLSKLYVMSGKLKIKKDDIKGLKPPFIVLATHGSFTDFPVTQLCLSPYRINYISELEGFENYGEWLYRQLGCLGTRKFINDLSLIRNIKKVLSRNGIIVIYPEARYANVGTSSKLPDSVGKLLKNLKTTCVFISMKGNYLQSPIWNLKRRKETRLYAEAKIAFTSKELEEFSVQKINEKLQNLFTYDEYAWQYDNKMKISYEKRAEGLEKVLYQCPFCKSEFNMKTLESEIFCQKCSYRWYMTEYGKMQSLGEAFNSEIDFSHIPFWYEWQRENVKKEIDNGSYKLDIDVEIESLPNAKNFIELGTARLKHSENGFSLFFKDYEALAPCELTFSPLSMTSIHTECDYRGKGECITLSTLDNTYFIFPKNKNPAESGFNNVKIQFATEYLYEKHKKLLY